MRLIFTSLCCVVLLIGLSAQTNHDVSVTNNIFTPDQLTIQVGDMVTWTNMQGFHNVNGSLADYPDNPEGFINGSAASGAWTFSHTFTIPGTYNYQCDPHVSVNMFGTIIVEQAAGGDGNVIITEISYNPPESGTDSLEYVELYNPGPVAVDMTGWSFTSGFGFTFPEYTLAEESYVIIAVNAEAVMNVFSYSGDIFQWTDGGLNNGGETITLSNANGDEVDSVAYTDDPPWPTFALGTDGAGGSVVLCDFDADNNEGSNWQVAATTTGVTINDREVFGNPGAASDCGDLAPVCFFEQTFDIVEEGEGTFTYTIIAQNFPANATIQMDFVDEGDPVTFGADVMIAPSLPASFTLTGLATENFTFDLEIIDDEEIEMDEFFRATLTPSVGEFVGNNLSVTVRDNDSEIMVESIDAINDVNADGNPVRLGETVSIQGVVHCLDFRDGDGYSFWIIEPATGDGMNIFNFNDIDGYVVMEGDELLITGDVAQFNGLTEVIPNEIEVLSSGNPILDPIEVTVLEEATESKYLTLVGYSLIEAEDAISRAGGAFNALVSNGVDTVTIRAEDETGVDSLFLAENLSLSLAPGAPLVTGIGSQFDNSIPRTEGYQVIVCGEGGFDFMVNTQEPQWASDLVIFPNPTKDQLNVWAGVDLEAYQLVDMQGRVLEQGNVGTPTLTIDMQRLPSGLYHLQLIRAGKVVNRAVVRQ